MVIKMLIGLWSPVKQPHMAVKNIYSNSLCMIVSIIGGNYIFHAEEDLYVLIASC